MAADAWERARHRLPASTAARPRSPAMLSWDMGVARERVRRTKAASLLGLWPGLAVGPHAPAPEGGRVHFLVTTGTQYYDTRLQSIEQTWGREMPPGTTLTVVGDEKRRGVVSTPCKAHDHGAPVCCKIATGLERLVAQGRHGDPFDWIFVADDDTYVNAPGVRTMLAAHYAKDQKVMLGFLGCRSDNGQCSGLCGGGGYAINRRAAEALVDKAPLGGFVKEYVSQCQDRCQRWGDMSISELGKKRGAELRQLEGGLYAWNVEPQKLEGTLRDCTNVPLTYHYLRSVSEYARIHEFISANPTDDCFIRNGPQNATA